MRLFSKKLTSAQEAELQEFTRTIQVASQEYEQALADIHSSRVRDLYYICRLALQEDRDLRKNERLVDMVGGYRQPSYVPKTQHENQVDTKTLIEDAREGLQTCIDSLRQVKTNLLSIKPADWYPKKYKKVHNSWTVHIDGALQYVTTAKSTLEEPEPLKHDPRHGNDKLNVFTYALNTIAMLSQELFIPKIR